MSASMDSLSVVFAVKSLLIQGGAERVLVDVASGLAERGHQVAVVTSDPFGSVSCYPLRPEVKQHNLGIGITGRQTKPLEAINRIWALRRYLLNIKPDITIGFMHSTYIPLGVALIGTGIPLIASEHTGIIHYKTRQFQRILLNFTPFLTKSITVVSEQIKLAFSPWLRRWMVVIPNPVSFWIGKRHGLHKNDQPLKTLLSVGRLSGEKNHKCLVSAFAMIADFVPDWNLRIVGEGDLRNELESQIKELGLEHRIHLPGAIKNIDKEYLDAQLIALPSLYESFGLVAAEAIYFGLPVVGFADCSGINQLVRHNENGLLVKGENKTESLALALKSLMLSPDECLRLGSASTAWLLEKYGIKSVLDEWECLLQSSCFKAKKCAD